MSEVNKKFSVLIIAPKPPYPKIDGGVKAIAGTFELLSVVCDSVDIFSLATYKHPYLPDKFPETLVSNKNLFLHQIDTRIHWTHFQRILFSKKSYRVSRFYDKSAERKLTQILSERKYDFIILESIYVGVYLAMIRKYSNAKILLRMHNVEHEIWNNIILKERNPLKKIVLSSENRKLRLYENKMIIGVDGILAISDSELRYSKKINPNIPIIELPLPIHFNNDEIKSNRIRQGKVKFFHIGAMDWEPNQDAMHWFLTSVFPEMLKVNPDIEFHMAGKGMPEKFLNWSQQSVIVHGEVDNANQFMMNYDVMIVPLRSGSGLRVKILDALSLEIPVISTSVGIAGLNLVPDKHFLLANETQDFINIAKNIQKEFNSIIDTAKLGRQEIQSHYSVDALKSKISIFLNTF